MNFFKKFEICEFLRKDEWNFTLKFQKINFTKNQMKIDTTLLNILSQSIIINKLYVTWPNSVCDMNCLFI